jgi:hypothetical protein
VIKVGVLFLIHFDHKSNTLDTQMQELSESQFCGNENALEHYENCEET